MGRYLSQAPRVKKQQVFTVSGTFTPSPGLLAAGGVVEVRCVGGGGGWHTDTVSDGGGSGAGITPLVQATGPVATIIGAAGQPSNLQAGVSDGGGSGADITRLVKVTGPVAVIIGAAGQSSSLQADVSDGGTTSFAALVVAPGGVRGGAGPGGGAGQSTSANGIAGTQRPAASGLCIVTWEE